MFWWCAAAVLLLGACGTETAAQPAAQTSQGPGTAAASATGPLHWVTVQPSGVTGARLTDDGRTLILDTRVPSGGGRACVRDLEAKVTESAPRTVRVQITFSSPSMDRASGCTGESPATTRVRLPEPLGRRTLVVDNDVQLTADGAEPPALRLCGELGCHPPATGCTAASYEQALHAADAPRHTYRNAEHCDGRWLVLDFTWRTGPACAGSSEPGCDSHLGDRWFFRAQESGWQPVAHGKAGGCADVHRVEPAFPAALCAPLAPLPG
uniref:hypothetical protein n=1 Tax=Streptomyces sp. SAT1 TaxID=1849967 RepID=UPI0007F9F32F|nr:hypothetical protein [Streptomyces sp. SAT1]ANO42457.1 hypothetical protein A8713_034950 [Streptomyces sp. SAT1]